MVGLYPVEPAVQTGETLPDLRPVHVEVVGVAGGGGLPHAVRDAGDDPGQPLTSSGDCAECEVDLP